MLLHANKATIIYVPGGRELIVSYQDHQILMSESDVDPRHSFLSTWDETTFLHEVHQITR